VPRSARRGARARGCIDPAVRPQIPDCNAAMTDAPHEGFPAAPRSGVESVVWPAVLPDVKAKLLAIEFQLEQSEWWTEAEIREHQLQQLGNLLAHAVASVPFYGTALSAAGYRADQPLTWEIWARLPILDMKALRANRDALASSAVPPSHGAVAELRIERGPGPVDLRISEVAHLMRLAVFLREQIWHRRDLTGKRAVIQLDANASDTAGRREANWGWPMGALYDTGPQVVLDRRTGLTEQVKWLQREDPAYLVAAPADVLVLAREFLAGGLKLSNLKEVQSLGGAMSADVRAACRAAWNARLTHIYRAEEVGPLALQCPEHERFHIQSEQALVEVLDEQGKPCGVGEIGRVVATPLNNFAMPLVRYDIGDTVEVGPPCACGRGLPVLTRIIGRDQLA
jgi:phenylacetate-CoA ligase